MNIKEIIKLYKNYIRVFFEMMLVVLAILMMINSESEIAKSIYVVGLLFYKDGML